jgi:hypothetical protein
MVTQDWAHSLDIRLAVLKMQSAKSSHPQSLTCWVPPTGLRADSGWQQQQGTQNFIAKPETSCSPVLRAAECPPSQSHAGLPCPQQSTLGCHQTCNMWCTQHSPTHHVSSCDQAYAHISTSIASCTVNTLQCLLPLLVLDPFPSAGCSYSVNSAANTWPQPTAMPTC